MFQSVRKLFLLLRPDLRRRWWVMLVVVVLASAAALGQRLPILLLDPLWNRVLFPGGTPVAAEPAAPVAASPGPASGVAAWSARLRERLTDELFGAADVMHGEDERLAVLWKVCALVVLLGLFSALALYSFQWLSRWLILRLVVELRQRLGRHLMGLSMRYHGRRVFGDLLSRISNDVTTTLNALQVTVRDLTEEPILVVISLMVAFYAAPGPALAVVLLLPLVALPISVLGRKVRRRSTRSLASLGASLEALTEMFRGIRTVKAFRAEERELERYREMNEDYMRNSMRMVRARAAIQGATTFLSMFAMGLLLLGAGWMTIRSGLFADGGRLMEFFLAVALVYGSLRRVARAVGVLQESAGAAERLLGVFDEPADIVQAEHPRSLAGIGCGIRFEGVTLRYPGAERDALHDVSIEIRPHETLALVGPSGAGKSTFIDLVARFIDPQRGRVTVDGLDLREVALDDWTRLYAVVGQVPFLFHTTVFQNIRYGRPEATREEIEEAARAANIHDFIATLPKGYETVVGDDGAHLSGGQRQRITIARAILKGAPVLLLDEATSALDSEAEAVVQEALERLMADRTVIVIAHRLSTVRTADRIAVLDEGRLVELGRHDELLKLGGTYARLHEVQRTGLAELPV